MGVEKAITFLNKGNAIFAWVPLLRVWLLKKVCKRQMIEWFKEKDGK
ncbi:hypothetical protein C5S53_00670 [Methanophagales archaeon]|nr:hypothetical protein C5S53_00670 [Methanophagales archaeon]